MEEPSERLLKATKRCNIAAGVVDINSSLNDEDNYVKGAILSNSSIAWVACGPRLTNINTDYGSKRTGCSFGWALGDASYKITCVEELPMTSGSPVLMVGCESEVRGSSLYFYHSGSSRVLKAVSFNEKITSLALVSKSGSEDGVLSALLKPWKGIVAVGTSSGKVYLVDVWAHGLQKCTNDYSQKLYDEQRQSKVAEVFLQNLVNNLQCETSSVQKGSSTLALFLNEACVTHGRPGLHRLLGGMPADSLSVSSLKFFPQISTLAIGYNSSCFQLWNLATLSLLYTSELLEAMLPVYSFALLEPSDDPRFVCYLWTLHHSVDANNIPFSCMYLLSYDNKRLNHQQLPTLYEGFTSCSLRYQLDLGNEIEGSVSGRIISCNSVKRGRPISNPTPMETDLEEVSEDATTSLLAISWEVWDSDQQAIARRLTLFDLHQWYREYMPPTPDTDYSRYMAHFWLPDEPFLDVKVISSSIRQFGTLQPVDEHFHPASTTFECLCLQTSEIVQCCHVGMQHQCLQTLWDTGPSVLLQPTRLYRMCLQAGIRSLLFDITSPLKSNQNTEQREYLLSISLEYSFTQAFLRRCVREWADGSHAVANCTLPSLLNWAWGCVGRYKKMLDKLCVPMFNFSGTCLDSNDLRLFEHMVGQLHALDGIFKLVLGKYSNCIFKENFEQQQMAIGLVTSFYDSVLWCVRSGVLPEVNTNDANSTTVIPYLTDTITNTTITRRAELVMVGKSLREGVPPAGLLLIDALISCEAGGSVLTDQWEREGGSITLGRYPPSSVQSLLRTYLVRGIPLHVKHLIVTYFLLDVAHSLSVPPWSLNEASRETLLRFPIDFRISESKSKIIQGFWCLDHQQFEEGARLLMDRAVDKHDIQVYQHRIVASLLTACGEHGLALRYLNVPWPGLDDLADIKLKMTLFLLNSKIHEAFQFQRYHSTYKEELLQQFFTGCVEMNTLDLVFKFYLTTDEEEAFMNFLEKSTHPHADDLRVLYLVSRSRYLEAIDMNDKLRVVRRVPGSLPLGHSPMARGRGVFGSRDEATGAPRPLLTTRDLIISSVARTMPDVTRQLADHCAKEKAINWKQVSRPTPLSVVVHTELSEQRMPSIKGGEGLLMGAALSKTRETWANLLNTPKALRTAPFLRTPLPPADSLNTSHFSPMMDFKIGERRRAEQEYYRVAKRGRFENSPTREKVPNKEELTSNKTTDMEFTCPASSALLHTPLVMRRVVPDNKESHTPHSILKGRSAANTPGTPTTADKLSSSISRQIRFSFPKDNLAHSTHSSVVEGDDEQLSPTVTPRKSIHQASSVKDRKGTPANPRMLRDSLRSAAIQLQFDDNETATKEVFPEISATAATLLNISQSVPCESTRSSLYSSPSQNTRSKSNQSFKLPLGLDGNTVSIDEMENNIRKGNISLQTDEEGSSNEESYYSIRSSSPSREVPSRESSMCQKLAINPNLSSNEGAITCVSNIKDASINQEEDVPTEEVVITNQDGDVTLTSVLEDENSVEVNSLSSFSSSNEVNSLSSSSLMLPHTPVNAIKTSTPTVDLQSNQKSLLESISYPDDPKSPKEVTINVQGIGSSSFSKKVVKLVDYNMTGESINEYESSLEQEQDTDLSKIEEIETYKDSSHLQLKKLTFKWTNTASTNGNLKLEVNKGDGHGKEICIAQVTISEEVKLFNSEPREEIVNNINNVCELICNESSPVLESFRKVDQPVLQTCKFEEKKEDNCFNEDALVKKESNLNENIPVSSAETNKFEKHAEEFVLPVTGLFDQVGATIYGDNCIVNTEPNATQMPLIINGDNTEEICLKKELATYGSEIIARQINENLNETGFSEELLEQYNTDNIQCHQIYEVVSETHSQLPEQLYEHSELVESNQALQEPEESSQIIITDTYSMHDLPEIKETPPKIDESFGTECESELNEFERTDCTDFELKLSDEEENEEDVGDTNSTDKSRKCDEPVLEPLKPLEVAAENLDKEESEGAYEEEEYHYEEDDDVDIYGDIEEHEDGEHPLEPSKQQVLDEIDYKERSSGDEVVCLSSESEDDMPKKALQTSTPYQRNPVVDKFQNISDESLDFEGDMPNEHNSHDDSLSHSSKSDTQNNSNDSGESDCSSSSSSSASKSLDPGDSNSEEHHGNRSWKDIRKSEVSVEENYENAIEPSLYESMEQNPQVEIRFGRNELPLSHEKSNKGSSINIDDAESIKIPEHNEVLDSCTLSGKSLLVEEIELDPSINLIETQPDTLKLPDSKRKECVETGSLLDLKRRRSKHFRSADNLSLNNGKKLRRKSCSMHDLASVIIAEQVSARRKTLTTIDFPTVSATITDEKIQSDNKDSLAPEITPKISSLKSDVNAPCISVLPEPRCDESNNDNDPGSGLSPKESFGPEMSNTLQHKGALPEYLKRQSKLLSSRFSCTLQEITEERSAENSSLFHHIEEGRRSLRKSLSSEQLTECHFEIDSLRTRPSSSCALYEFNKTDIESKLSECNNKDEPFLLREIEEESLIETSSHSCADEKTNSQIIDIHVGNLKEKIMAKGIDFSDHKSNVVNHSKQQSDESGFDGSKNKIKRTRADSEPSYFEETDGLVGIATKRRSSSLLKVESIHKKLFSRPFKRRSTRESLYQSLEIVDSDDSFKESRKPRQRQSTRSSQVPTKKYSEMNFESMEHSFEADKHTSINETSIGSELQPSVVSEEDSINLSNISPAPSMSKRSSRASSEPPSYISTDDPAKYRRSSSLLKINQINKLLFGRYHLRKSRASRSSCFKNLEVVNSSDDEKSIRDLEVASTSDNFDEMENVTAPHVQKKNGKNKKEPNLTNVIPEENENTNKKRKCLTNKEEVEPHSICSRKKQVEVNEPSKIESLITTHEVKKKLKKSDLIKNKTSKSKSDLHNLGLKKGVEESISSGSSSKSPIPEKKRGRMIKRLKDKHDTCKQKSTPEGIHLDSSNTENATKIIPTKKKKKADLGDNKDNPESNINKPFSGSPKFDKDTLKSQKRKQQRTKNEPQIKKKRSVKAEDNNTNTNVITKEKTEQKQTHEDKHLESLPEDDENKPVKPLSKNAGKKSKKMDSEKLSKKTKDKKVAVSKTSASKKTGDKQLETHQSEVIIKSLEEVTLKKTRKTDKIKTDNSLVIEKESKDSDTESHETPIKAKRGRKKEKAVIDLDLSSLDSPARRTRRSTSRMSDTELLMSPLTVGASKLSYSKAMSDIGLSSPNKADYAISEASDATSRTSGLTTPTRRSTRKISHSTPGTPDMKQEDYLIQRRLTRNQHHLLQKSFELSLTETQRPSSRLEVLPEESGDINNETATPGTASNLTPIRSSARNAHKRALANSKQNTPKK